MRKLGFYILTWLLLGNSISGSAQKKFMAYRVTGTVTYSTKNQKQSLKIGKIIPETATINVGPNSTAILICEQASTPITLQKGTHNLATYTSGCDPQDQSVTANYLKYVWKQMTDPKAAEDEKKERGAGGVSRGCAGIDFYVPDTLNYYREDILLTWKVYAPDARKEFVLYKSELSPVPILALPINKDEIHLDSLKKWLVPGEPVYWTITLDGGQVCPRKLIQVWDNENFREFMETTEKEMIPGIDEAEKKYFTGYILEENLFMGEAYKYYKMAREARSGDDRYKRTETRFKKMFGEED